MRIGAFSRVRWVGILRNLGFTLAEIKAMLTGEIRTNSTIVEKLFKIRENSTIVEIL